MSPADLVGCLTFLPLGIIQCQVGIGVAVGDAVDGDSANIGLMVEAVFTQ